MPTTTPEPLPDAAGDAFASRARQLVAFLAARPPTPGARLQERELADWIAHWRQAPMDDLGRAQHFVREELGIILRALSGPPPDAVRWRTGSNDRLCWLIARCMADTT